MRVLIIGASGGIGAALAQHYAAHPAPGGVQITRLSRRDDGLDLTNEGAIRNHLAVLEPPYHRIVVAIGGLEIDGRAPEKSLRALGADNLMAQFALNAIGPALVLKHALRLMPRDQDCRFAVLSARVGSIGDNRLGGWHSYRAAKAALNQLIHTAAIEIARTHPQAVVALLHPGTVATPFTAKYQASHPTVSPETAAENLCNVLETLTPAQTGGFFDWAGKQIPW